VPPARKHSDQAKTRTDLPHSTSAPTHVGVGQAHELVATGLQQHALQQNAVALVYLGAGRNLRAGVGEAPSQSVAQTLEVAQAQEPGSAAVAVERGGRQGRPLRMRERRHERIGELALELGDLAAQRPPRVAFLRRMERAPD